MFRDSKDRDWGPRAPLWTLDIYTPAPLPTQNTVYTQLPHTQLLFPKPWLGLSFR